MKTIALRFGEHFAPETGTIAEHNSIIEKFGYVWYGKMGSAVSKKNAKIIMEDENPKILLIRSGHVERYWAYVKEIKYDVPDKKYIPEYYRDTAGTCKTWFKIAKIEIAPKDVMSKCVVTSSKRPLGEVSKHSMSPFFVIETDEYI